MRKCFRFKGYFLHLGGPTGLLFSFSLLLIYSVYWHKQNSNRFCIPSNFNGMSILEIPEVGGSGRLVLVLASGTGVTGEKIY